MKLRLKIEGFNTMPPFYCSMSDLVKPEDLDADSTEKEVAEAAYYAARISDSTYHGTYSNGAQNVIVAWSKKYALSPASAYGRIHDKYEETLDEMTA